MTEPLKPRIDFEEPLSGPQEPVLKPLRFSMKKIWSISILYRQSLRRKSVKVR